MILLMTFVGACQTVPGSLDGYCTASEAGIKALASALSVTPDEAALRAGDLVIRQRDAACP
jgi:hypothetical protein